MSVIVLSEGPSDAGDFVENGREGCIRILVRRILQEHRATELSSSMFFRGKWARVQKQGMKTANGFRVKLAKTIALYQATLPNCTGLAVVVDRDKPLHDDRLEQLRLGRTDAASLPLSAKTALGMAIEEVEAWLLGAHDLLHSEFQFKKNVSQPETVAKPKELLRSKLQETGHEPRAVLDQIAASASLMNIRTNCPSFAAFAEEVATRIAP